MKIPTPDELRARPRLDCASELLCKVVAQLRASHGSQTFCVQVRDEPAAIALVADALRAHGWKCVIEKGGARDCGKTDGLTVRAPE